MDRGGLRDDEWDRIKDFLPGREGHVGGTAPDNRRFVDAVLYRYRTGIPWRDLPAHFGSWKSTHQRFSRWCKSGVFDRVLKHLAGDADAEYVMIDATIVRAHQHSAGARKKGRGPGHRTFQGNVYGRSGTYAYGRSGTYAYGNTANYGYGRSGYAYGYGSWRHRYWAPYGVYAYSNSNSSGCYYTYKYSNRRRAYTRVRVCSEE